MPVQVFNTATGSFAELLPGRILQFWGDVPNVLKNLDRGGAGDQDRATIERVPEQAGFCVTSEQHSDQFWTLGEPDDQSFFHRPSVSPPAHDS